MEIFETERTILREVTIDDTEFILDLMNQPSFIEHIGDREVRTSEAAREYIESRFLTSYKEFGYGMWAVELRQNAAPIGICGFVKRDFLPHADIGFAFLPQFERQGYAFESARAALRYGRENLNLQTVLAITSQANHASIRLLEKLGFEFQNLVEVPHDTEKLKLFSNAPPQF